MLMCVTNLFQILIYLKFFKNAFHKIVQLDDITRTAREVDKLFGERTPVSTNAISSSSTTSNPVIKVLLSVQHKNLNPTYEMKRMFGSKVVQAEQ